MPKSQALQELKQELHISHSQIFTYLNCSLKYKFMCVEQRPQERVSIALANSEVGILALSIEAFYLRLICTNGMIAKTAVDARYKHISRKVMDEFPMILEGVISQSRQGYDRFMISTQTPVSNPESTIDTFARQFQITQEEAQIVKQTFYQEQGGTMFHVIQAFTRAAQFPNLSASDSYRLEKTGGHILGMVKS
jgi:hypothetical protein